MSNDTVLTIIGNLTADPELRVTPSGVSVARFTVASTPRVFDKASGDYKDAEPLFLTCTAWRHLADNVAESLTKGARVVATGRLKQSHWQTDTGEKRSAYGLDVDEIGPSLRFATAKVHKFTRSGAGTPIPPDDPFATASPARPANDFRDFPGNQPASAAPATGGDDEPPF